MSVFLKNFELSLIGFQNFDSVFSKRYFQNRLRKISTKWVNRLTLIFQTKFFKLLWNVNFSHQTPILGSWYWFFDHYLFPSIVKIFFFGFGFKIIINIKTPSPPDTFFPEVLLEISYKVNGIQNFSKCINN